MDRERHADLSEVLNVVHQAARAEVKRDPAWMPMAWQLKEARDRWREMLPDGAGKDVDA